MTLLRLLAVGVVLGLVGCKCEMKGRTACETACKDVGMVMDRYTIDPWAGSCNYYEDCQCELPKAPTWRMP